MLQKCSPPGILRAGFVPNVRRGLLASLRNLPIVRDYVHEQMDKIAVDVERSLNKCYAHCNFILSCPTKDGRREHRE
ncbi:hypothetical protein HPB52_015025 [Rhipicephalus sanguineus]|uniref:Uncharacterized protein n=1 Tax=Rhipicephalus sanguineus TaxID=34632 RepID=A0A9D4TAP3_RHISA|nr:hypothetical protein HPB52_015025 [Rhipicephalus sanguineus]